MIPAEIEFMTSLASRIEPDSYAGRLTSRGDLTSFFMTLTAEIGADCYMLVTIQHDQDRNSARILASNWIHDAIELAGHRLIARLAQTPAAMPGTRSRGLAPVEAPSASIIMSGEEAKLLDVLGHSEIYSLQVYAGDQHYFLMFSASETGKIRQDFLTEAQLRCCYALSQSPALFDSSTTQDRLSQRERECLSWVSEGKTTDEIALILGVSGNTINNYITHAIQKLSANNRAMAIATAIRNGII